MERRFPKPKEIVDFAKEHSFKFSIGVAGIGIVLTPVLRGRIDTLIGTAGALAASYAAYSVIRNRHEDKNEGHGNNETDDSKNIRT